MRAVDKCSPLQSAAGQILRMAGDRHEFRPTRMRSAADATTRFGIPARLGAAAVLWLACPGPPPPSSSSTSPRAWSSRCRSRSASSTARAPSARSSGATSPTWSAPTSSARGCSGRSTGAPSSSRRSELRALPRFADWRQINAQALVTGEVTRCRERRSGGRVPALGRVRRHPAARPALRDHADNWRRVAHKVADAVYERITGETRLFRHPDRLRRRERPGDRARQAAGDHGSGRRQPRIPYRRRRSRADAALPPGRRGLAYMAYRGRQPQVYQLDLATGAESQARRLRGHDLRPAVSRPDGRRVAMTPRRATATPTSTCST